MSRRQDASWARDRKGSVEDSEAYSDLYERSYAALVGQVFVVTTDRAEAEEAVQEAFVQLWTRRDRIAGYENPEAWVRRVAINTAIKRWHRTRRGAQLVRLANVVPGPASEASTVEDRVDLVAGLRRLPVSHRHALLLHYVVGLSVQEIADEMSTRLAPVRPGTVKSWLHRGRAELNTALTHEEADDV
jgi:RNA polymerase sigma-70 factor (ECF subfamily)